MTPPTEVRAAPKPGSECISGHHNCDLVCPSVTVSRAAGSIPTPSPPETRSVYTPNTKQKRQSKNI